MNSTWLFVSIAFAILAVYIGMWILYICIRYERSQWWLRMLDPESYPSMPWKVAIGEAVRARLDRQRTPTENSFVGRYRVCRKIAEGDASTIYLARFHKSWSTAHLIKIPRHAGVNELLRREHEILFDLQTAAESETYGEYFPVPLGSFTHEGRLITIRRAGRGWLTGMAIRHGNPHGIPSQHIGWMFNRTLEALGYVHQSGWIHGAVLPTHLMFNLATHGLKLVGWTHAVSEGDRIRFVPKQFASWYPESCRQHEAATPAIDIHLAARSMLWLAGESVGTTALRMPPKIHRFLNDCLRPARVTLGAWALHAQFRELLEEQFGPPKFCRLPLKGENDGHHLLV